MASQVSDRGVGNKIYCKDPAQCENQSQEESLPRGPEVMASYWQL